MSYLQRLIEAGDLEAVLLEFPKNESSWEELFDFGRKRITEIMALRARIRTLEGLARRAYGVIETEFGEDDELAVELKAALDGALGQANDAAGSCPPKTEGA